MDQNAISRLNMLSEDYVVRSTHLDVSRDESTRDTSTDDFHVDDNVSDFMLLADNDGDNNS